MADVWKSSKLQKEAKNEANDEESEEKENENCAQITDPKHIQTIQCIMNKNTLPTLKRNDRSRRQRPETLSVKKIGKKRINDCLHLLSMRSRDRAYYHGMYMLEDRVVSIRYTTKTTLCVAIFFRVGHGEHLKCLKITNRDEEDEFNKHLQLEAESDFADLFHVKIHNIAAYGNYSDRFISYCCDLFPGTLADLIHRFDGLGINARNTNTNSIVNSYVYVVFLYIYPCTAQPFILIYILQYITNICKALVRERSGHCLWDYKCSWRCWICIPGIMYIVILQKTENCW